jgi:superoxide dismutase, Fe-Mn family
MNIMVKTKAFSLPPLPYDAGALEPIISKRTMEIHHGRHHAAYVKKLNDLVDGTPFATQHLEEIVNSTYLDASKSKIFNNAAQAWNHAFFWSCLGPTPSKPQGQLAAALERDIGDYETFKTAFVQAGVEVFGTGWVWLVCDKGKLCIESTPDAVTPIAQGKTCILTIDVWEHAYYLDYQDKRAEFLKQVTEKLLNWDFAGENFERAG